AILNHTEATEGKINAYMEVYKDEALTDAKKAEKEINNGNYKGMYHGIPMAVRDNIYFKDKVTTMSSKIYKDFVYDYDATVVSKLIEAVGIFTGKLSIH